MHPIFNVFIVLCLSSFVFVHSQADHKVNVAVYYESLCTDSVKFITTQLYPALQKPELSKHVNLTLVPYGKTKTNTDQSGNFVFHCHHDVKECEGNKIHACAIANITSNDNNVGKNQVTLDFINCLLGKVDKNNLNADFQTKTCAENTNVGNIATIGNCVNAAMSTSLLKMFGEKTAAIENPLTYVPTIVFDEKFNQEESSDAKKDFIKVLCSHIKHDQPADCKDKNGAGIQTKPIGISLLTLVIALKLF